MTTPIFPVPEDAGDWHNKKTGEVYIDWWGGELEEVMDKAIEQATMQTLLDAKERARAKVHRISGTLDRSIHVAPWDYNGEGDEGAAEGAAVIDVLTPHWTHGNGQLTHSVGSWISYARTEYERGWDGVDDHNYLYEPFRSAVELYPAHLSDAFWAMAGQYLPKVTHEYDEHGVLWRHVEGQESQRFSDVLRGGEISSSAPPPTASSSTGPGSAELIDFIRSRGH